MDKSMIERPGLLAPLVLAYIGDGVYELYVRNRLISEHTDMPVHTLHKLAIRYVKAQAQSLSIGIIEELLDDEELAVYKRGRNAKSATVPKNADVSEYRRATGFEALIGYLYLSGKTERLDMLMSNAYDAISND